LSDINDFTILGNLSAVSQIFKHGAGSQPMQPELK